MLSSTREKMRQRLLAVKGLTKEELHKALVAEGAGRVDSASADLALIKLYCKTRWPEYERYGRYGKYI